MDQAAEDCAAAVKEYEYVVLLDEARRVALGQRPVEGWGSGAYQEFSVSMTALRKQLFEFARG